MTHDAQTTLVLRATGKTGSRIAADLSSRGLPVRTAAPSGAQVHFEWRDRSSYARALDAVDNVYLLLPLLRTDFAGDVGAFLDDAEAAGVTHFTLLSMYGIELAPKERTAWRDVELDLLHRPGMSHSILRPTWFMQNFSDTFLKPVDGAIIVPTGSGSEAFIDADDIAVVAAMTLAEPKAHANAEYSLTGPGALTVAEAAAVMSAASGQTIVHVDLDRDAWVAGAIENGVPAEYGAVLKELTEIVASGNGSRPNDTFRQLVGRPPRSFPAFARDHAAAWKVA